MTGLLAHLGEITTPTSTGQVAYTGVGFTPKAIIFFSNRVAKGSAAAGLWDMTGFLANSGGGNCNCVQYPDALATTNAIQGVDDDACIFLNVNNATTIGVRAAGVSMNADGFTLDYTVVEGTGRAVQYLALGGDALSAFDQVVVLGAAETGTEVQSGFGFAPKVTLFAQGQASSGADAFAQTAGTRAAFGAGAAPSQQFSMATAMGDNAAESASAQKFYSDKCCAAVNFADADWCDLAFQSNDADGWTLDHVAASNASRIPYLSLGGTKLLVAVGTDTQKTSTGTQAKTGIGFRPQVLIFSGNGATADDTIVDNVNSFKGAAIVGGDEAVCAVSDTDAADPTENGGLSKAGKSLCYVSGATPSVVAEANVDSVGADGYTLNWTTADATARRFGFVALAAVQGQPYRKRVAGVPGAAHQLGVY